MAEFTEDQKEFVVRCWARRLRPAKVLALFREHYPEAEAPPSSQLARYNPNYGAGNTLSPKHRTIYDEARAEFEKAVDAPDLSSQAFRVQELTSLYYKALGQKNLVLAKDLLKQAAQERGGLFEHHAAGPTDDEVHAHFERKMGVVRKAVEAAIPEEEERERVLTAIKEATKPKLVAGDSGPGDQ